VDYKGKKLMQRIAAIKGEYPAIIVVPHGYDGDDYNTSVIGEQIIDQLNCYGVINYAWQRADKFDYYKNHANCNSISQLHQNVVKQEFFDPIVRYCHSIYDAGYIPSIYIIHGFSKIIHDAAPIDVILGVGNGDPPSWTCENWISLYFAQSLQQQGFRVAFGKSGGKYSGRNPDNLNQLDNTMKKLSFLKPSVYPWHISKTESIQIEISRELRETKDLATLTGSNLAYCIQDTMSSQNSSTSWAPFVDHTKKYPQI
jgi:hypothetical protein